MLKKYASIDALRGLAVLGVVLVHCGQRADIAPWLKDITDQGARGVQLFFILSALTLFLSMKNRSSSGKIEEKKYFFIRRFFRIAPMFYLAAIFYTVAEFAFTKLGIGDTHEPFNLLNLISTFLFFTNDFNPDWINKVVPGGWSITVEMTFYLFVPLLFMKIRSIKSASILIICTYAGGLLLNYLMSLVIQSADSKDYLFYWFPNQITIFCMGILAYHIIESGKIMLGKNALILILLSSCTALFVLPLIRLADFVNLVAYGGLFVIIVCALSKYELKILVNLATVFLGKLSFSLYLTHFIVLRIVTFSLSRAQLDPTVELVILYTTTLIISVAVSALTYRFIEEPSQKMASMFIQKMKKRSNTKTIHKVLQVQER